jgi:hypothetical protein
MIYNSAFASATETCKMETNKASFAMIEYTGVKIVSQ